MKRTQRILLVTALLGIFSLLLASTAKKTSLVYDEVIYAPVGVLYWKTGNLEWNKIHPPLQKYLSAVPLLKENLVLPGDLDPTDQKEWLVGFQILFQDISAAAQRLFNMRVPSMVLSVLTALLLFLFSARKGHFWSALLCLSVFVFDPLVLGNGALAMNDIFVTSFFLGAILLFILWCETPQPKVWDARLVLSGLSVGAAIGSKFSGLLLVPVLIFISLYRIRRRERVEIKRTILAVGVVFLSAGVLLLLLYQGRVDLLFDALTTEASVHAHSNSGGFLLVPLSSSTGWFYYPIAWLIKTPLPLLILTGAAVWALKTYRQDHQEDVMLFITIMIVVAAAFLSRNHFGVRYLLPLVPFVALLIGKAYRQLQKKSEQLIFMVLALWLAGESVMAHPHHMAYFNQLIGGSGRGHKWLMGSNQDWGQDLPALADYWTENGKPALFLSYWGSNHPGAWGLIYQDVFSPSVASKFKSDVIQPVDVKAEWLVVSAALLHGPATREVFTWLKKKQPRAVLGHTLFVYDITDDEESVLALAGIYKEMGRGQEEGRQRARASFIHSTRDDKASRKSPHP